MASVASRPRALPRVGSFPAGFVVPVVLLVALTAFALWHETRALGEALWMDEGLSIGIAAQPILDIPHVLRVDGSPPLYYMLLGIWTRVIGDGPAETQGLSVAISLLAIPSGLWAGWSLFGRRAGYITAALFAFNGFIASYAQETRMYALMMLLSLLVTATFLHVYVYRRRRYLPFFGLALAAMLYTHNWGLFVTAGALTTVAALYYLSDERRTLLRDAALGFGFAGLLYAPWLPTLVHQVQHTGAPWLNSPRLGAPIQITKSLLGGGTVTVAIVLAGGSGLAEVLKRRTRDRESIAIFAAAGLCVVTLAIAWVFSQFSPAWTTRYLGVALAPILLLAGLGLARAGNLGLVALVVILGIWGLPKSYELSHKSNASDLRKAAVPHLRSGDLVVSMQPEQTPLLEYHLTELGGVKGLRWATPLGAVDNSRVMDWTDSQDRIEQATVRTKLEPLLANLPRSRRVLLVEPITERVDDWDAPWTQVVRRRSAQWSYALATDRRFKRIGVVPPSYRRSTRIGVRGVLYEKIR